jgi:hypothetical protein
VTSNLLKTSSAQPELSVPMERASQSAADFVRQLAELVTELAKRDIVVGTLHADWSAFGSWTVIARKHNEAVRFFWDGRDGFLTVEGSPVRKHSAPNEWREECVKGFDRVSGADPVWFVAEYLEKRFPV